MLGRRGYALESFMARVCREAGGRVRTNLLVRDVDVPAPNASDGRRLEAVVDCLPVRGGPRWPSTPPAMARQDGEPTRTVAWLSGGTEEERTHIPRTPWPASTGATCGRCSGSWRSLVRGDQRVCERTGTPRIASDEENVPNKRGACGGEACWLAQRPVQSPLLCSTCSVATAGMGTHLTRTRWTETTAMRDWG